MLEVDPVEVAPGEQMFFLVTFPEGAQGEGVLSLGDGRSHEIPASVGELEVVETAPMSTGSYRATLEVTVDGSQETYEASYEVQEGTQEQENPGLAVGFFLLVLGAWVGWLRRSGQGTDPSA